MKGYPIPVMNLEEAKEAQFRLVDQIHREFVMDEFFQTGDVGLAPPHQFPVYTEKVERVLAAYFGAESALLVRGAGTGAIRAVFNARLRPGAKILVHDAPIYPTTLDIIQSMGLVPVFCDYHRMDEAKMQILEEVDFALVQHSRQKPEDSYHLAEVLSENRDFDGR